MHPAPHNPFWDQRFAEPGFKYGTAPNAFLAAQVHRLPAGGRVWVPGDGEGRNGVWLAGQGMAVRALDSSAVGLAKARRLAGERGIPSFDGREAAGQGWPAAGGYATALVDLAHWAPAPGEADAAVLVYVHLPSPLRRRVHQALARALRPGGVLLLEAFEPRQLSCTSGGPRDVDMLPTLQALRDDFDGLLDEELGEATLTVLDEGPGHQGEAWVLRWIGRRRG